MQIETGYPGSEAGPPGRSAASAAGSRPPEPKPPLVTLDRVVRLLLGGAVVALLATVLWYLAALVIYLIVGLVVAYLLRPVVDRFQGVGLGRIAAILATFALVIVGISVLLTFLLPFVARQVRELSQQVAIESAVQITAMMPGTATGRAALEPGQFIVAADSQAVREVDQLQDIIRSKEPGETLHLLVRNARGEERIVMVRLGSLAEGGETSPSTLAGAPEGQAIGALGLQVRTVMFSDLVLSIEQRLNRVVPVRQGAVINALAGVFETLFREERLTQFMGSIVGIFTDIFYAVLVIPFVAFFVLKDGEAMRHNLLQLVPNRYFEITLSIAEKIETNIGRYFRGLLVQCLSIGTVATILLSIVGLRSSLAVGIFAGLANTIPYFGPLMGFLAGTLVGVAQTGDFSLVPGVLIAMGLTQIADNVLFQPLIFSRAAQAHPLIILFVVLIGAQLGGIIGMLVAIPLATIVRVMVQQVLWSLRNYRILRAAR